MQEPTAIDTWSSRQHAPAKRFARWREAVCDTHLAWDIPNRRDPEFAAQVRQRRIADASLIECACDPCEGRRGRAEIAGTPSAYYGVLHLLRGREMVRQAGREACLEAGDMLLWDSTRPIEFAISGTLHKITLLVPQSTLDKVVTGAAAQVIRPIRGNRGCAALFASHLRSLASEGPYVTTPAEPVLRNVTLELLSATFNEAANGGAHTPQRPLLQRAQSHILANLGDPALTPQAIARALGTSVRQLHRAFEDADLTIERWIWRERLQRCHADIVSQCAVSISQIAFKWGFSDASHFSRAFHSAFGVSAREARRRALQLAAGNRDAP